MAEIGNDFVFNDARAEYLEAIEISNSRSVIVYKDKGNGDKLTGCVIDIDGEVIQGTETVISNIKPEHEDIDIKKISSTKIIIAFGNHDNGYIVIVNILYNDILEINPIFNFASDRSERISIAVNSYNRILVSYKDHERARSKLLGINEDNTIYYINSIYLIYEKIEYSYSLTIDNNHIAVLYAHTPGGDKLSLSIVNIENDNLSIVSSSMIKDRIHSWTSFKKLSINKFIVVYSDRDYNGVTNVISTNQDYTEINVGNDTIFNSGWCYFNDVLPIDENKAIVAYCSSDFGYKGAYSILNIDDMDVSVESVENLDTGIFYDPKIVDKGNGNFLIAYNDNNNTGTLNTIIFNTIPDIPIVNYNGSEISQSQTNPLIITDINLVFNIEGTDPDGDTLEYKIILKYLDNSVIYNSGYQSDPNMTINGIPQDIIIKVYAYTRDTSLSQRISHIYYIKSVTNNTNESWFENTPYIIHDCENGANVKGPGESLVVKEGFNKYGNNCLAYDIDERLERTKTVEFFNLDLSINTNVDTFRCWFNFAFPIVLKNKMEGGVQLKFIDSNNDYRTYYVEGFDTYKGGWKLLQLNRWNQQDEGDSIDFSNINKIQIITDVNTMNSMDSLWIDCLTLGSSYNVVSDAPITLDTIAQKDQEEGWGIFTKENGIFTLTGTMILGNNTTDEKGIQITGKDGVIVSSMEPNVLQDHHNIIIQSNSHPSIVIFGELNNNKGSNGLYMLSNSYNSIYGPIINRSNFIIENQSIVSLYGCNFNKYNNILGFMDSININNTEFKNTNKIDIIDGVNSNNVFTNSRLNISVADSIITNGIFKDNNKAITFSSTFDTETTLETSVFINNVIDLSNDYTEYQATVRAKEASNPTTTENNVVLVTLRTLTLTHIQPGTEVRIYTLDRDELIGTESLVGTIMQYEYNYTEDLDIYIILHNLNFKWIKLECTLTSHSEVIQVHQEIERNYLM